MNITIRGMGSRILKHTWEERGLCQQRRGGRTVRIPKKLPNWNPLAEELKRKEITHITHGSFTAGQNVKVNRTRLKEKVEKVKRKEGTARVRDRALS